MPKDKILRYNFMDLDEENSTFETSKVVVLPVPYEKTVTFGTGTSKGPSSIIHASTSIEMYDDELDCEHSEIGIHTFPELKCDIAPEKMFELVRESCSELIDKEKFVITLGGEHSITAGAVKAHKDHFEDFSVLSIDAHCDLRASYEGTKYSHACVMRRVVEEGIPVVQVGIRSCSVEEAEFLKKTDKVKVFHARDIVKKHNKNWIDDVVFSLKSQVYLSIDLDGFDPSLIPSTGTPEPGGLSWYDVVSLLKKVFSEKEVIGMDIVELAPIQGLLGPDVLAAKLAYKAIGYKYFLRS